MRAKVRDAGAVDFLPAQPLAAAGSQLLADKLTDQSELDRVLGS
jgi:hypothetical protein